MDFWDEGWMSVRERKLLRNMIEQFQHRLIPGLPKGGFNVSSIHKHTWYLE